ncbi:MAG: phytanoyl-CoA dioxygenase family protein [Pseudomonadota bacterium]
MNVQDNRFETYFQADLAAKYRKTRSEAAAAYTEQDLAPYLSALERDGFVVLENLIDTETLASIRGAIEPLLAHAGRNAFEGLKTQRIYAVVAKTLSCNLLAEHPLVLALLDRVLSPGYLLSQLQVINILPGEAQQSLHYDDVFYPFERPRAPLGAATVWALDDFVADNGSTKVIPGSHKWAGETPANDHDPRQQSCVMPAGSAVLFLGTLWHGGGANSSAGSRLAVTAQYCEPYLRQQENFSLSVPAAQVARCSEDLKRMLGYSIHSSFMGMVDGKHPKRLLEGFEGGDHERAQD